MFSTVLAYYGFIVTSVIFVALIADAILNRKSNDITKRMYTAIGRPAPSYMNVKMLIICIVWVVSGIYLWG